MNAWHRGKALLTLLEYQQEKKMGEKVKCENRLKEIIQTMMLYQQEHDAIGQKINRAILPGVINRRAIYQRIQRQSVLLARQQDIAQEMIDLQNLRIEEQRRLQECRHALSQMDKKHHKTSFYLRRVRRELLLQADMDTENEIQELVEYGGKNNGITRAKKMEF